MKCSKALSSFLGAGLAGVLLLAPACSKSTDGKDTTPPPSTSGVAAADTAGLKKIEVPGAAPRAAGEPEGAGAAVPVKAAAAARVYATDGSKKASADGTYTIAVAGPAEASAGAASKVEISVTPATGWKMNKEFPTRLVLSAPDGVSVAKAEQRIPDAAHFDEHLLTFAVEFTPAAAGEKQFTADFKFAVCTESTCDPKTESLAWIVKVN